MKFRHRMHMPESSRNGNEVSGPKRREKAMSNLLSKLLIRQDRFSHVAEKPEHFVNRRKLERFPVGSSIYVLLSWNTTGKQFLLGHLTDINEKGCGICYITDRCTTVPFCKQKPYRLQLMGGCEMFELRATSVVYDYEMKEFSSDRLSARRCGIRFDKEKNE